ncbi:MAG: TIM-barrel domain-containing protein [Halothermotrichaceae bacterium]
MASLKKHFQVDFQSEANKEAVVVTENCRFSILTSELIRMEYDPKKDFDNRPSQVFWNRKQPVPEFSVSTKDNKTIIETKKLKLVYQEDDQGFTADNLNIDIKDSGQTWYYGDDNPGNLGGTYRTLDAVDGSIPLEKGLLSKSGWSIVDDSQSLVFNNDTGWLESRGNDSRYQDLYFFGYGRNYPKCLQDYVRIAGEVPLIPRWALGNWWSRYWEYSQKELGQLMLDFENKGVPLSVCIIDMDWHIVDNPYTRGWTGYTWNNDLFPEPEKFIEWIHEKGLKTALNLHPADGIHPHEANYPQMAEYMGLDPEEKEAVEFDIANPRFINGYFEIMHNTIEDEDGVDFWWIDWQQGEKTKLEGLDPLWALNHLHFYDLGRNGDKRNFIFSRWSGLGSHRYPIGFSGDTVVSWDSLAFQPYFTANASNVGYGWWSHDIGGHCMGQEDDELYARWVQYGVFSPIMRLHSTKDAYMDRRPWGHGQDVFQVARDAMQLRHALIPYLYTMAWENHKTGIPLVRPMYYFDECEEAYSCPDQYYFGTEMIAAPFVSPKDDETNLSKQLVWLPEGKWFDFFSGECYQGDSWYAEYGNLNDIPLFARQGAIVPMGPIVEWGGIANPESLNLHIFPGADNSFELYEDNGQGQDYQNGKYAVTLFKQCWRQNELVFEIKPVEGDLTLLPEEREYKLIFKAVKKPDTINIFIGDEEREIDYHYNIGTRTLTLKINKLDYDTGLKVSVKTSQDSLIARDDCRMKKARKLLKAFKMKTAAKQMVENDIRENLDQKPDYLQRFASVMTDKQLLALIETLLQTGAVHISRGEIDKIVIWNNNNLDNIRYNLAKYSLFKAHPRKEAEGKVEKVEPSMIFDLDKLDGYLWDMKINFADIVTLDYK